MADHKDQPSGVSLLMNRVETDFQVKNGKLIANHGDRPAIETDHAYMLSALGVKNILINKHDYSVTVRRRNYAIAISGQESPLELFQYSIAFPRLRNELKKEFPVLGESDFVETSISLSEAPTKCYVFASGQRMDLLCHYGIERNDAMPVIISRMKNE